VTQLQRTDQPQPNAAESPASTYSKGDLLHPEWGERAPWFGYIGVGIAIVAMLIGIAGMALGVLYVWRWMGS
jgi:hypothetical protein